MPSATPARCCGKGAAWPLWMFGAATVPPGLYLWHRLGPSFGLGEAKGKVSWISAYGCLAVLLIALGVELFLCASDF